MAGRITPRDWALLASVVGVILLAQAVSPPDADARGFRYGVAAAEIKTRSAVLWSKAKNGGPVLIEVRRDRRFGRCPVGKRAFRRARHARRGSTAVALVRTSARRSNDHTVQRRVKGLRPGRRYRYRFCMARGRRSRIGKFKTAPPRRSRRTVRFAISGDQDAQPAPGSRRPHWGSFRVLSRMRAERNQFNVILGDWIYSDTEVPGVGVRAYGLRPKWAKYRRNLGQRSLVGLRSAGGVYNHWDDHEFINDFSRAESSASLGTRFSPERIYRNGVRAFRDYAPVAYRRATGIYRRFRWGRNVELFFLDERSFRSAKASAGGACDNPATGQPDFAPTSVGTVARTRFGAYAPSLTQPVSPACLATIRSPARTMLGARQLRRFLGAVRSSNATFKVIVNEVPIQQYYWRPYDRWEGYEAERRRVLRFLRANVRNAIFLTTDAHASLVNDARLRTLESGGPLNSGLLEVTTGPIATKRHRRSLSDFTGQSDAPFGFYSYVYKPRPPNGVGIRCAAIDRNSYAEVRASRRVLRVVLKDERGGRVRETAGATARGRCGPVVIRAR